MPDNLPPRVAIIADDETTGRLLLLAAAEQAGLTAMAYDNGRDALESALLHGAALVLLDVDMPQLDGYAVCRHLRGDARFATTPIVMVTGREDAASIARAFEAGATDYVAKPVNWALLPRRLAYTLRNAQIAERARHLAYFDPLTTLSNRQYFLESAAREFAEGARAAEPVAVTYLDLNHFKRVNDTFGHSVGDCVLQAVAQRLRDVIAAHAATIPHLSLARFGGDEFVILLRHREAEALVLKIAEQCRVALKEPISHKGLEFHCALSAGTAVYPQDGADPDTILKHADTAMYQAKSGSGAQVIPYQPAMSARSRDWLRLESKLHQALKEERIQLLFQPKVRLVDQRLSGAEALLRWRDCEQGEISPNRFVEIAEDSTLILELGAWLIRAVCQQLRQWLDGGFRFPISINVSGKELLCADPAQTITREAAAAGVPTSLIEVEITESVLLEDSHRVRAGLEKLRAAGCRIALDDFGTGYCSLSYVTRFPPDRLKIDRSFVRDVDRSRSNAAAITAILSLANTMGLAVTAEGIERPGQLQWLRARGCEEGQGFLLGMPMTAREFQEHLLHSTSLQPKAVSPAARLQGT